MFLRVVRRLLMVGVLLVLPALAFAQEATLSGAVSDSTGGVLPGATLTAVHEASGNTFEGITDERGALSHRGPRRCVPLVCGDARVRECQPPGH